MITFSGPSLFRPESPLYRSPQHLYRECLGRFVTGVAVVSCFTEDEQGERGRHGLTVNSFTSVSLDPPLVLVSVQRSARSHALLSGRGFTVNVLGAEQQDLAWHFAGRPRLDPPWVDGSHAPRLLGALAHLECTPWAEYDGGDHTLFLGRVQAFEHRAGDALSFVGGRFTTIPESLLGYEAILG